MPTLSLTLLVMFLKGMRFAKLWWDFMDSCSFISIQCLPGQSKRMPLENPSSSCCSYDSLKTHINPLKMWYCNKSTLMEINAHSHKCFPHPRNFLKVQLQNSDQHYWTQLQYTSNWHISPLLQAKCYLPNCNSFH